MVRAQFQLVEKSNIIIFVYKTGKIAFWTSSFVVTLKETTMKLISSVISFTLICIVYANDSERERDGRSITYLYEITSSRLTFAYSFFSFAHFPGGKIPQR